MDKATLYIPKDEFKQLRSILLLQGISASEWFRKKARYEINQHKKKNQQPTEGEEGGEILQKRSPNILPEYKA